MRASSVVKALSFVGPSYTLTVGKAALDRSVNLYLVRIEAPEKAKYIMQSAPGYTVFADLGAPIRGCLTTNDRTFFVAGSTLYELESNGAFAALGTLSGATGPVDMEYGVSQLVMVDGASGYALTLGTDAFHTITAEGFYGSDRVEFLDNYFIFVRPDTGQFYITAVNDATSIDALDFATAESAPDNLVVAIAVQRRLLLMGALTTEIWFNSGATDFPFEREGSIIEVGCMAAHSAVVVDNTVLWIGRDKSGAGMVYRLTGYQGVRISTHAVEQALQASSDLSAARAYAYQDGGHTFYAINAPGLTSTWVYDVGTSSWHERCDVDFMGQFEADRGVCHTYAFGKHLIGGTDGIVYHADPAVYTKGGDPLVCMRQSPHMVTPALRALFFSRFALDCETGGAGQGIDTFVELSFLNYRAGSTWSNPALRSLGKVGERFARLEWYRLGKAIDRVWRLRYSGNAPFAIVNVSVDAEEGTV